MDYSNEQGGSRMELFGIIGVTWVMGMAAYIMLSGKSGNSKRRCNVKKEVMQFKVINNQMSAATKSRGRR